MGNVIISQKEIKTLANIYELTPENLQIIKNLFDKGISTRQIYLNLPETLRRDMQIIELCAKYINQSTLKSTLNLVIEQTGMEKVEFLKIANKYHPNLVCKYIKNNKVEIEKINQLIAENPDIYQIIASSQVYSQEEKNKIFETSPKWIKEGKPVQYISLETNVQFTGREDYLKLVQAYLDEDSSMIKFCSKYHIDKDDFNKVLNILAGEDKELGEKIEQVKEHAQKRYIALMQDFINKIISGELDINQIISVSKGRINGWDFLNSSSFVNKEQHQKLLQKMLAEFNHGYKEVRKDKMYSQYSLPVIGGSSIEQLGMWFDKGKGHPLEDIYNALGLIHGRLAYTTGTDKIQAYSLMKKAKSYGGDASNKKILLSFFENPETKQRINITEKNLNDALTIIKANKKLPSHKLTILIIRDIVYGRISESEITEAYMTVKTKELEEKAKQEKRKASMSKVKSVDDYIGFINNNDIKRDCSPLIE